MDTKKIEEAVKMIIEAVGEDENRGDFRKRRPALPRCTKKSLQDWGRQQKSTCLNHFEIIDNNMVVEKDIFFHSM